MGKRETIKYVYRDLKDSCMKLPQFFYMVKEANKDFYTQIKKINIDLNFRYGFMAIIACINGFIKYMRPLVVIVVVIDVSFIKKNTRSLTCHCNKKNGNNQI